MVTYTTMYGTHVARAYILRARRAERDGDENNEKEKNKMSVIYVEHITVLYIYIEMYTVSYTA